MKYAYFLSATKKAGTSFTQLAPAIGSYHQQLRAQIKAGTLPASSWRKLAKAVDKRIKRLITLRDIFEQEASKK